MFALPSFARRQCWNFFSFHFLFNSEQLMYERSGKASQQLCFRKTSAKILNPLRVVKLQNIRSSRCTKLILCCIKLSKTLTNFTNAWIKVERTDYALSWRELDQGRNSHALWKVHRNGRIIPFRLQLEQLLLKVPRLHFLFSMFQRTRLSNK